MLHPKSGQKGLLSCSLVTFSRPKGKMFLASRLAGASEIKWRNLGLFFLFLRLKNVFYLSLIFAMFGLHAHRILEQFFRNINAFYLFINCYINFEFQYFFEFTMFKGLEYAARPPNPGASTRFKTDPGLRPRKLFLKI